MTDTLMTLNSDIIASLVINGDLKRLTPAQKVEYYNYRCQQAALDPAAKPFDLLTLNGKEILYANAGATQQLTNNRNLSHQITARELTDGIYCVFCRVAGPDGRSTENMGAVPIEGLKGESKANAMLKATTKAIRRSVLAHCGLGLMDETEVETIPGAIKVDLELPVLHNNGTATLPPTEPPPPPTEVRRVNPDDKLRPQEPTEPPVVNGWTLELQGKFNTLVQTDLYQIFKDGGHPEMFTAESEKWKANKAKDPEDVVMTALEKRVKTLKDAAAKAKATAPAPANPPESVPAATPGTTKNTPATTATQTSTPATSTTKAPTKAKDVPDIPREAGFEGDYKAAASAALTAACQRFEAQYTAQRLENPHKLAIEMRDTVLKAIVFPNDFSEAERKMYLGAAIQAHATKLKIP
jgi:hypothetical protein